MSKVKVEDPNIINGEQWAEYLFPSKYMPLTLPMPEPLLPGTIGYVSERDGRRWLAYMFPWYIGKNRKIIWLEKGKWL